MRNLKKLLAVLVVVVMLAGSFMTAFAAEATTTAAPATVSADGKIAGDIGALAGEGSGVDATYLAKGATRLQAAIISLRLQGKLADALATTETKTFADASKVTYANGKKVLAYLFNNPTLGWVGDGKNFDPNAVCSTQMIYKVMLESLGYKAGDAATDNFKWADTLTFAASKKLDAVAAKAQVTNDDIATIIVETLKTETTVAGTTLAAKLVAAKVIDATKAAAAGLVAAVPTTVTVVASGAKKLTVTFPAAIDDTKAVYAVAKGSIAISIAKTTVAADKKSVVLELASKITAGDYTVTVSGLSTTALTAKVTAADEKIDSITFPSDKAIIVRDGTDKTVAVSYLVFNQYKEDITSTATLNATISRGTSTSGAVAGTIKTTDASTAFVAGNMVSVSLLDTVNNTFKAGTFTVATGAKVDQISITKLYNIVDNTKVLTASDTGTAYKLILDLKDQYGNAIGAPANATDITYLNNDIAVSISDSTIASLDDFVKVPIDGKDYVGFGLKSPFKAGKAIVTMVSKTTGKLATFTIEVKDTVKVDSLNLSAPAVAAAGTKITVPFTAVDQFGNAMTKFSDLNAGFNSVAAASSQNGVTIPSTGLFVQDYVKNTANLVVDATSMTQKGTITLTFVTSTYKVVNLKIDVTDVLAPASIAGYTTDFTANVVKNATTVLKYSYIKVKDQYAQDYDPSAKGKMLGTSVAGQYRMTVATSDASKVALTGTLYDATLSVYRVDTSSDTVTLTGVAKGSSTITVTLQAYDATKSKWADVSGSSYAFNARVAEIADITSYTLAAFSKVYNGDPNRGSDVSVKGVLADGTNVVVDNTHYSVIPTDTGVKYNTATNKVYVITPYTFASSDPSTKDIAVVVTVDANDGAKLFTPNVTVDKSGPVDTTLTIADSNGSAYKESASVTSVVYDVINDGSTGTFQAFVKAAIKSVDQYGVELTSSTTPLEGTYTIIVTNIVSADSSTLAINAGTNATTAPVFSRNLKAGDTFNVTATVNGKIITFKVIVKLVA